MENPLRNEVTIRLAGQDRVMRATFSALTAIEKALGKSIMAVINQVAGGDLAFSDAATIVFHGLKGGNSDNRLTLDQVGEAIVEEGLAAISVPIVEFVSKALGGVSLGKPEGQEPQ